MNKLTLTHLRNHLANTLRVHGEFDSSGVQQGICYSFSGNYDIKNLWRKLVEDWPHFSGNRVFPVSGVAKYFTHREEGTLWKGEQLELRLDLINHVISKIDQLLGG